MLLMKTQALLRRQLLLQSQGVVMKHRP